MSEIRTSQIGKIKRKIITGIIFLIIGILTLIAVVLSFLVIMANIHIYDFQYSAYYWWIWLFIAGFALYYSYVNFSGWYSVKCPYCEKAEWVKRKAQNLKCRYCKYISIRKGDVFETVKRD